MKNPSVNSRFQSRAQALPLYELELLAQAEGYLCAEVLLHECREEHISFSISQSPPPVPMPAAVADGTNQEQVEKLKIKSKC